MQRNRFIAVQQPQRAFGVWTPEALTPYCWFNDESVVTDVSGTASQWNDISGNNRHATQVENANSRPTINTSALNGRRVLEFDGSDDFMSLTTEPQNMGRNINSGYMFCVFNRTVLDGSPTQRVLFVINNGTTHGSSRLLLQSADASVANRLMGGARRLDADSVGTLTGSTIADTGYHMILMTMNYDTGSCSIYFDGNAPVTNASMTSVGQTSDTATMSSPHIGATRSGALLAGAVFKHKGCIAELLFNQGRGVPSGDDIDRLFGYAAHRWGLTSNLPAEHPYKSQPPISENRTDPHWPAVTLLLTDSANDRSAFNRTINVISEVNRNSEALDFVSGYLSCAETADFGLDSGDYTLEAEIERDTDVNEHAIFELRKLDDTTPKNLLFYISADGDKLSVYDSSSVRGNDGSAILGSSGKKRIAFSKRNGTLYAFIEGVLVWSATWSHAFLPTRPLNIGANAAAGAIFDGKMRNIRITKGVGRWVANYSVEASFPTTGSTCRWDAGYTSLPLVLSNNNQRVTLPAGNTSIAKTTRGTIPRWSGKWYFELKLVTAYSPGDTTNGLGIASQDFAFITQNLATFTANTAVGVWGDSTGPNSRIYKGSGFITGVGLTDLVNGTVVMIAIDIDAQKIWVGTNGTWHNSGNPAASYAATASGAEVPASKAWYPACSPWSGEAVIDLLSGARECIYTIPAGFNYW